MSSQDGLAEALPVALLEGRAKALTVVRQDDELVRTRRLLGGLVQGRDRPVDPVECLERFDALGPAVVGQLVVVGEVRVDDVGAPVHLVDDQRGVHVAQEDVAGRPHPGVLQAAVHLRLDPGAPRAPSLVHLLEQLPEEQRERAQVARRAEEERREGLAVTDPATLGLDGCRREVGRAWRRPSPGCRCWRHCSRADPVHSRRARRSASRRPGCSRPSGACGPVHTSGMPGSRRCCRAGCLPGSPRSWTAGSPPSATACAFLPGSSWPAC